jgi:uncharacterized OsmC-like protein
MRSTSRRRPDLAAWKAGGRLRKCCFAPSPVATTTTFHALAERSKLDYADLEVEVEGVVRKTASGYAFEEIVIRPNLTISGQDEQSRALRLLQKAKTVCLVSRALSVEQKLEPRVQVGQPV